MKKVTELCLGVAVAGVVAGAGSSVACAVASAAPSTPDSGSSSAASDASGTAGPAARTRSRASTARAGALAAPKATGGSTPTASMRTTVIPGPAAASRRSAVAVPAKPASAPVSVPTLPVPTTPVGPASSVNVSASTVIGRTRSRTASVVAAAAPLADPPPVHVLLIGTDGTNLDKVLQYAYDQPDSGFRAVMQQGVTGATTLVGHTTISGPSWTTILTGVWDNKSGVINNIFNPKPYDSWPTVFNLIEYNRSEVATAVYADWKYINDMSDAGGYPADVNEFVAFDTTWENTDDKVVDATIARIAATAATDSSFIFSYQVAVDEAGHAAGGGSPEYAAAVVNTSENIKRIMDAVDAWETANPDEEWTVIVTTDHGHQQSVGFGHGFQSPNETSSFVIADIAGDSANDGKQNLNYSTADITPTIADLFNVPLRSDFDGVPLQTKNSSIVTPANLNKGLSDAIGMYGYPNIGTDLALGVRTVVGSVPYFLGIITESITAQLQAVVDQQILLISTLAQGAQFVVQLTGDVLVAVTQAVARVVGHLTGAGSIAPTDPPLPAPPADSVRVPALSAAALV